MAAPRSVCSGVATAGEGSPHTSLGALPRMRPSARGSASSASLQSMLVDIMGEHAAAKVGGSEEKVAIRGLLGKGMQGTVYLGRWKGVDVAYKVDPPPPTHPPRPTTHPPTHTLLGHYLTI